MNTFTVLVSSALLLVMSGAHQPIDSSSISRELNGLNPELPAGYLELGEEILLRDDRSMDQIAIELIARATFYGYSTGSYTLASTACLALTECDADIENDWLWDLALIIDPSRFNEWLLFHHDERSHEQDAIDQIAAECLYAIRFHQYPESVDLFQRQGVRTRILEAGESVGIDKNDLLRLLQSMIERGSDDPCRGRLYIIDRDSGERRVCPNHVRALGFCSNDEDLQTMLRVEMVLLGIQADTWESASALRQEHAIKIPTIEDLMERLQVDPSKAYHRDGKWQTSP